MQQITPIEIRQKKFGKSFRGYNTDEVDAFLYSLSHAWEKLIVQFSEVSDALEQSSREIKRLQGVENAIVKTLNESESTARNIIEKATQEADLKTREAEFEVGSMLQKAHEKAKAVEEEYAQKYQAAQEQMTQKLEATKKVVQEIEVYRDSLLQKLQTLAEDILAKGRTIEDKIDLQQPAAEIQHKRISESDQVSPLAKATPAESTPTQSPQKTTSLADENQTVRLTKIRPLSAL